MTPFHSKSTTIRFNSQHVDQQETESSNNKNILPQFENTVTATSAAVAATTLVTCMFPSLAVAVDSISSFSSSSFALSSALAAYGHYLCFGIAASSLVVERVTIQSNMSKDQETKMVIADAVYGISAALILFTGYLRLTQYGKGWEFYSHEPLFWVKMWGFMILGASSLFPTVTLIKRAVAQQKIDASEFVPMSDKLVKRMTTIINAELLAIFSIPFLASTMARGLWYEEVQGLPVEIIGPVVTGVLAVGGGIKYLTEALSWSEE